ncbi:MAG: ABC transporter ATP-binding protein [Sphaerochaeta sp.]|jgi:peptide/nickel transport system ATP-binding protein|nr:ABC transporter ATP-binding protein [Sphaerochaeta sp.]
MKTVVDVQDLHVNIELDEGRLEPVRGVSFSIAEGETLGLVGESGCGKSLTSRAILGINEKKCISSGKILFDVDGKLEDLLSLKYGSKEIRAIRGRKAAMIFQEPMVAFHPMYTIGKQINESTLLHITKDKEKSKQITLDIMKQVGIANAEKRYNQYPHEFSGGMLQRALIAMALVCRPALLIADEPTTALDVTIQAQILDLMKELQKAYKMAILFITHDLGVVAGMCDRVAVMYLGQIVEEAPVKVLYSEPLHPYTQGLLGSVHKVGTHTQQKLFSIEGTVPLALNLPDRCGFYERCKRRGALCEGSNPALTTMKNGHKVRCYYPKEVSNG